VEASKQQLRRRLKAPRYEILPKLMKWISNALIATFNSLLLFALVDVVVAWSFHPPVKNAKKEREQIVDAFIQRHGIGTLRGISRHVRC
jgi:hypothetical protein